MIEIIREVIAMVGQFMRRRKYEENENDANMCAFDLRLKYKYLHIRGMCIQV